MSEPRVQTIYSGGYVADLGIVEEGSHKGWLVFRQPFGQWVTLADIRQHVDRADCPRCKELEAEVERLREAIRHFLADASKTPPWKSAGSMWVEYLRRLNAALSDTPAQDVRGTCFCERKGGDTIYVDDVEHPVCPDCGLPLLDDDDSGEDGFAVARRVEEAHKKAANSKLRFEDSGEGGG